MKIPSKKPFDFKLGFFFITLCRSKLHLVTSFNYDNYLKVEPVNAIIAFHTSMCSLFPVSLGFVNVYGFFYDTLKIPPNVLFDR